MRWRFCGMARGKQGNWRRGLICALLPLLASPALLLTSPVSAQAPAGNAFTGNTYGSGNLVGPPDPDKLWLQPGNGGPLFESNDYINRDGMLGVVNRIGVVQTSGHPFFDPIGSNGRGCVSCHQPSQAMSLAAANLRMRWDDSQGHDPVFASVDGSDCPILPQGVKASHGLALDRGVFRIALPWPPKDAAGKPIAPEFTISVVRDPNGCNSGAYGPQGAAPTLSVYRRPRMVANFPGPTCSSDEKMAAIMADGRVPSLKAQAIDASLTHLEMREPPNAKQLKAIVDFECQVNTAQSLDRLNWVIAREGAPPGLGPQSLADADAKAGAISATLKTGDKNPAVFLSFDSWKNGPDPGSVTETAFRRSVARGAEVFSSRPFQISGAAGINTSGGAVSGTCATCHDIAMTGMASARWIDTGSTNQPSAIAAPDLPLFKITCNPDAPPHPFLGRVILTQDPGRALVTGKCADVGAITVQQLRGLSARAPYFSNGSAKTLGDVVDFYDQRFKAGYSAQEKQDLVNFLSVL
jgi:hypothetical protein